MSLYVYSARGSLVKKLVVTDSESGHKRVTWNGRDDAGRAVASGVYYAVLFTPEKRLAKKMTLLK